MYTKTTTKNAIPWVFQPPHSAFVGAPSNLEKKHSLCVYSSVFDTAPEETLCLSLSELSRDLSEIAGKAEDYSDASSERLREFKQRAPAAVFAKLEGGRKKKDAFRSTSLIAVDVDQKGGSADSNIGISQLLDKVRDVELAAVLYTTFSYQLNQPCFRLLIDLGKDCDWEDHQRSCIWLKRNLLSELFEAGGVDNASWSPVQPMVLPFAYRYQQPHVELVRGRGLWDLFRDELASIKVTKPEKTSKKQKLQIGQRNLNGCAEKLFVKQVGYLHKPLKFARKTAGSTQFWRNNRDSNPGLFCKDNWKMIFDPAKSDRHFLQYSLDDYRDALDHQVTDRSVKEGAIRGWIDSDVPYALFTENCGTGKSEVLVSLSSDSPQKQRYIFTFSTLANRDAFALRANNAVIVKSTSEIIKGVVGEKRAQQVLAFLQQYYAPLEAVEKRQKALPDENAGAAQFVASFLKKEKNKAEVTRSISIALRKCVSKRLISREEQSLISSEIRDSRNSLSKTNHLLMTTRKFEFLVGYSDPNAFNEDVIFTDEHQVGMLTNVDDTRKFEVYGAEWTPENPDGIDRRKLHDLKRCIVTSENVAAHELRYNKIRFVEIAAVQKTADFDTFEVLLVSSTSSQSKGDGKSNRRLIKDAVDRAASTGTIVIGDKLEADYNLVSCKGTNDLREKDTVVLLSMPSAQEIAQTQACTGLSRWEATSLIMSDKANQAVGRNQGYRNKDGLGNPGSGSNRCLLIIPTNRKEFEIDLHYVTPKVVNARHWSAANDGLRTSEDRKKEFYFKDVIDEIVMATQ
ncbi:hypothetical protein SAMN04487880_3452 [Marinobacter sp. es.042]|uniref:hypothetical protein n=1 Tax=Marinobacter sp. es.042 TaxID=1761794 RepID=UPI000B50321E|nr:hypothetical protein [Marinobacter sp. es.042]SNB59174.1 hypothetical protein SAMN04487880_3452 [Marinobacter sp. es.042]